jgi:hypothetical protein
MMTDPDKIIPARKVLCKRMRLQGFNKYSPCDGEVSVCGWCDNTVRMILSEIKEK